MKIRLLAVVLIGLSSILSASGFDQPVEAIVPHPIPQLSHSLSAFTAIAAGGGHTCAPPTGGGVKCWGGNEYGQLGDGTTTNRNRPVYVSGLSSGVTALAAGRNHTCAAGGGGVKCWGWNLFGQLGDGTTADHYTPVDVLGLSSGVTALAAGENHTCALTAGGGVKCWGGNATGQLGDGTTADRYTPVDVIGLSNGVTALAAGWGHTCAVTAGGGVKCWGDNGTGQLGDGTTADRYTPVDVTGLTNGVTALAVGWDHTCALTAGGARCWGHNWYGQLGDGTTADRYTPVDVIGLSSVVTTLAAGRFHTCALTAAGGVICWGDNGTGQLGDDTTAGRSTPVDVIGLSSGVTTLAAGGNHTCALTAAGGVKCWGDNGNGQLGDGLPFNRSTPVGVIALTGGVTALAAGWDHTCAVTAAGGVKCWGKNEYGQLGDGTTADRGTPGDVIGLSGVTALATGGNHTCALTAAGGVKCWGLNDAGQLGDGTSPYNTAPVDVSGLTGGVAALAPGLEHTCAGTGGGVKCWAGNGTGELGDGTICHSTVCYSTTPVDVSGLSSGVTTLAAGRDHTCALTAAGGVKCWGWNGSGQLGVGIVPYTTTPADVSGLSGGVTAVAVGGEHTCAVTAVGEVKCWGWNSDGQLGDGTTTNRYTPVDVIGLSGGVTAVAAGEFHTCALVAGGVKCWGGNGYGQLGDGTTISRSEPSDVIGLSGGITATTAGYGHTCALTAAGGVKCWGRNQDGDLGDGTTTNRRTPGDVSGLMSSVTALAASSTHTCALVMGGWPKCWGNDSYGQLGIGTIRQSLTPVDVVESPARLRANYAIGRPGSYFTLAGENFLPGSPLTVTVNSFVLTTTLQANDTGRFMFLLDTTAADVGGYSVNVSDTMSAKAFFILDAGAPLRPQEGNGQTLVVPAGIVVQYPTIYLPMLAR